MTQPTIDITPDASHPEGGHAIILLRGLTEMPASANFRISALADDPDDPDSSEEWSLGEHEPLAAEMTGDGLALKVGPEIVDAPELQPGAPVAFKLAAADVLVELSWPDLPITIPELLAAPVIDTEMLRAHKVEQTQRAAEAEARAREALRQQKEEEERANEAAKAARRQEPPAPVASLAEISKEAARPTAASPRQGMTLNFGAAPPPSPITPANGDAKRTLTDALSDALNDSAENSAELGPVPRATAPSSTATSAQTTVSTPDAPRTPQLAKLSDRIAPPSNTSLVPQAMPTAPAPARLQAHVVDESRQQRFGLSGRRWAAVAAAVIAVPMLFLLLWQPIAGTPNGTSAQSALDRYAASDWVTNVLAVGERSPNGVDATGVTVEEAMRRAEQQIFGASRETNLAERKFWLRKAITMMLATPRSRWALTQLGALRTNTTETRQRPDYLSAKTLWEIASASGDAVATCFLAQIYELGLGIAPNQERAAKWHKRAQEQGGCNLQRESRAGTALTN